MSTRFKPKTRKHKIKTPIKLHNEFTFKITEFETEACEKITKQWEAKAYNLILTQGIKKLADSFKVNDNVGSNENQDIMRPAAAAYAGAYPYTLGGWIQYGTGNTTPVIGNTALNTYLGHKYSDYVAAGIEDSGTTKYGYYTQKITILPSEHIGSIFKEVGLASGAVTTAPALTTHALIVDSGGNPLSITKTATMQIDIYSKFYIILGTISYANTTWASGTEGDGVGNCLLKLIAANHMMHYINYLYARTGTNDDSVAYADASVKTELSEKFFVWDDTERSEDDTAWIMNYRYETNESNGKIKEIGASMEIRSYSGTSGEFAIFRSVMPVTGVWTGTTFTDENIGTGDGVEDTFVLDQTDQQSETYVWNEINETNPTVKVAGVTKTAGTHFNYTDSTGAVVFTAGNIPTSGQAITGSWSVPYIAKSNDYVLDIEWEISFSEGTVPT